MWHVDEGTLHAYLDDRERGPAADAVDEETRARVAAHLAVCDVCTAQLEAAARLRARATNVLLAASPVIETPPFPALTPRAATTPVRVPARRPWVPLAWAASVTLAVGAGWLGSQLWRGGALEPTAAATDLRSTMSPATTGEATAAGAPLTDEAAQSAAAEPQLADGPRLARAEQAEQKIAVAPAGAPARPEALDELASGQRQQLDATTLAKSEPVRPQTADVALSEVPARAGAAQPSAAAAERRVQLDASADPALRFAATEAGYAGDADVVWRPVSRAAAEKLLGGPVYLLADTSVSELAAAAGARPPMVRVRQPTIAGEVELVQWREGQARLESANFAAPPTAPHEARALPTDAPAVALGLGRARDGGRWLNVPGAAHVVIMKVPPQVDSRALLTLLARVKRGD